MLWSLGRKRGQGAMAGPVNGGWAGRGRPRRAAGSQLLEWLCGFGRISRVHTVSMTKETGPVFASWLAVCLAPSPCRTAVPTPALCCAALRCAALRCRLHLLRVPD